MKYDYLLFDADMTLINFDEDEKRAFRSVLAKVSAAADENFIEYCFVYAKENWKRVGLNDMATVAVQKKYHALYPQHICSLIAHVCERAGVSGKTDEAEEEFYRAMAQPSHLYQNSLEVLEKLSSRYKICVVTNGLTRLQRPRLAAFTSVCERIFVSEELGTIKPSPDYFRAVFQELSTTAPRCLMIGDSASNDIAGALSVDMDCVYFNSRKHCLRPEQKGNAHILKTTDKLDELFDIL